MALDSPEPALPMTSARLAQTIEHTLLRADATLREIEQLCTQAKAHHFFCVCVNSDRVAEAVQFLEDSPVKVTCAIGFPLGANDADVKRFETEVAVDNGAHEIDTVLNLGRFKDQDYTAVLRELRDVVEAADERPVKVILETALLNRDQKITACKLVLDSGARFVKTSTGFGPSGSGATVEDVQLLRETVGERFGVKASGGIRTLDQALNLIKAGANRLGTSAGVTIVESFGQR